MPEQSLLLGVTSLRGLTPARIGPDKVTDAYAKWIGRVRDHCGAEVASLFARPASPPAVDPNNPSLAWHTSLEGPVEPFDATKPAGTLLRDRLEKLEPLLLTSDAGPVVASWLYVPSTDSILSVGGQPVLINWGHVPDTLAAATTRRENHFKQIIGPHAPEMIIPPFTEVEEAAYLAHARRRWEQLRARRTPAEPQKIQQAPSDRSWRAPLAAALAALLILLFLLYPGVLIYPDKVSNQASVDREAEILREGNRTLEQRLALLRDATQDRVCRAPEGQLLPLALPGLQNPPGAKIDPLLPPWDRIRVQPPQTSGTARLANLTALIADSSALIVGSAVDGARQEYGTGVFIADRLLLTTRNVIDGMKPESIKVASRALGRTVVARIIARSPSRPPPVLDRFVPDFALLQIDATLPHAFLMVAVAPGKGREVVSVGYPESLGAEALNRVAAGDVSALQEADLERGYVLTTVMTGTAKLIVHSAQAARNKAGALVDLCGRLVGVNALIAGTLGDVGPASFAQDADEVRRFLAGAGEAQVDDRECVPQIVSATRL